MRREQALERGERGLGETSRYSLGNGARYTSGTNGPSPCLYGRIREVIVNAIHVRPWNAPSKAITACRFVARRATFTAFSTASAPELKKAARVSPRIGNELAETLRELDVALVRHDRVVGVQEPVDLLADRFHHARMVVPDVRDADPAHEVDEGVAVDVRDRRSERPVGHHRGRAR